MGAGLGAALVGTRPVIEMRIFDFTLCAMDELANQIAKIRYMTGGQARPALVVTNATSPDGLALTYTFELYVLGPDGTPTLRDSASGVPEGPATTTFTP